MHVALAHHCRRGDRQRKTWNEAADYAVNPILIGNGFTLPAGVLLDPSFDNLSAEEIYARLIQRPGNGGSSGTPSPAPENPSAGGSDQQPGNPSPSTPDSQTSDSDGGQSGQQPSQGNDGTPEESPLCEDRPGGFGEVLDATDEDGNPASPAEKSRQEYEWAIAADQALPVGLHNDNVNRAVRVRIESVERRLPAHRYGAASQDQGNRRNRGERGGKRAAKEFCVHD